MVLKDEETTTGSSKDEMGWFNIDTTAFAEEIVAAAAAAEPSEEASPSARLVRSFFREQPASMKVLSPPVSLMQPVGEIPPLNDLSSNCLDEKENARPKKRKVKTTSGHNAKLGEVYECTLMKRDGGLGLTLACLDDGVKITGLATGSPADGSGILVGDLLVQVGKVSVEGLAFSKVISRLKSDSSQALLRLKRTAQALDGLDRKYTGAIAGEKTIRRVKKKHEIVTTTAVLDRPNALGISENQYGTVKPPLWDLRVCINDRDRHWQQSRRLLRQLELNARCNQDEQRRLWDAVAQLEKLLAETTSGIAEHPVSTNQVDVLSRKLFSLQAKIREYEIREVRRSAEAASQASNEKRHAAAEAERVKVFLAHQFQSNVQLCELNRGVTNPICVRCEGVRLSIFHHLFPMIKRYRDDNESSGLRIVSSCSSLYDFQLDDTSAKHSFGWNFSMLIRSGDQGYALELAKNTCHVTYDADFQVLKLECLFECIPTVE